jgi:SAM-dependent methyltransferase
MLVRIMLLCQYFFMSRNLSGEETRDLLIDYVEGLETIPGFGEPTEHMYELRREDLDFSRSIIHTVNRGKRLISMELNMTVKELEALFIGKSVLDVGCGSGVLSRDLARLKRTRVTALDKDPEMLAQIKENPDLKVVQGSGFDVKAAVGDEKFDIGIVSYSSNYWAETGEEKTASILSPLGSIAAGGKLIIIPVLADPAQKEAIRRELESLSRSGLKPEKRDKLAALVRVGDWLDVLAIDTLLEQEEHGAIACTFASSRENTRDYTLSTGHRYQRYSAVADVLQ